MRRLITLTIMLALSALIVSCSGSESDGADTTQADGGSAEPEASITIAGFAYSGAESVSVGDTVRVTNEDTVGHTWTAIDGEFDSGTLSEGDSFDFTFEEAGEFDYFCSIHPEMAGTITVEG